MVHRWRYYFFVNIDQQLTTYHFSENFGTFFLSIIRDFDSIPTVTRDGRVAFVGVDDIAKAAYDALVTERNLKTEYYIIGPQLYSYDEVSRLRSSLRQPMTPEWQAVALLSKVLGRSITHKRISAEESNASFESLGIESNYASLLTSLALQIASGDEEALFTDKKGIIGEKKLQDYFEANKELWAKK